MTESRNNKRVVAIWLLLVLAFAAHVGWLLAGGRLQLDTDVLAMLPQDERQPAVQQATRALAEAAQRRVVVLIGGGSWDAAKQAADRYAEQLNAAPVTLKFKVSEDTAGEWLSFFTPYRGQLLSAVQREQLRKAEPAMLAQQAVEQLYRPMGMPRVGAWAEDPLNLFSAWLGERAAQSRVRVADGRLSVSEGDRHYALLMLELKDSAFSMSAQQALLPVLEAARAGVPAGVDVLTVGVPLHAAAAANQAEREVHTIGIGSLAGIVVLTLFAFRSIRPRLLVTLSIATGLLAAVSVTSLVFGQRLHMITLVFGASLVGVAENYGSNYFASRSGRPFSERWLMLREQAPVMWLAMATTAIGYALLALTPFPGLRQIAVFSVTGLLAAFITTLYVFPLLDRGEMPFTRFSRWLGSRRALWPVLGLESERRRFTLIFSVSVAALLVLGAARLRINDDIRTLQNSPAELIAAQRAVGALMDIPSPAQFYLVRGASEEELLQREEALVATLQGLNVQAQAVSAWLPSQARQAEDAALLRRINAGVLAAAGELLGETLRVEAPPPFRPLLPGEWLAAPVSEPLRHQWLGAFEGGFASVVMLRCDATSCPKLAALQSPGAQWVDKVAEVSTVMARTRLLMAGVIFVSYALVFAALSWRFGKRAWRALAPTALASALALALPACFGAPLQLFNVLALLLILGMGVDYGIFMLEQPARDAIRPWLSVSLAAVSTLLAFGLLALSQTPALRAFGLTMLLGIALAWWLTPLFMPTQGKEQTKPMRTENKEILIIGAGPAGSVAAGLLRQQGREVLVIEQQQFPRFSIGESLLPQSMEYIEAAGFLQDVVEAGFQYKNGAAFRRGDKHTAFDFREKFSCGWGTTYQVQRATFDQVLANAAAKAGAEVRFLHQVTAVDVSGERPLVTVKAPDGEAYQVSARFLLDASGFGRILPRLLDLETPSNFPVRGALFTHVEDHISDPTFDRNKILVSVHPEHVDVWFWTIPFSNGRCSQGVVARAEFLEQYTGDDTERLRAIIAETPTLSTLLKDAVWDTPARKLTGYAANVKSLWGRNFALLGNAGEFLDPVFSSGVTIAFKSASLAAAGIAREFAGDKVDWQADYGAPLKAGVDAFRAFVESWYRGGFQDVIFHKAQSPEVRRMISAILAGYAWDTKNPYVAQPARLKTLEALCAAV